MVCQHHSGCWSRVSGRVQLASSHTFMKAPLNEARRLIWCRLHWRLLAPRVLCISCQQQCLHLQQGSPLDVLRTGMGGGSRLTMPAAHAAGATTPPPSWSPTHRSTAQLRPATGPMSTTRVSVVLLGMATAACMHVLCEQQLRARASSLICLLRSAPHMPLLTRHTAYIVPGSCTTHCLFSALLCSSLDQAAAGI